MAITKGHTPRWLLALLATWAVGLPALLHYVGGREAHVGAEVHFWLVATGALVAAAASIGLTVAGARARDSRTVLLGAAFSTMTALLAIHGIATPGDPRRRQRRDRRRRRRVAARRRHRARPQRAAGDAPAREPAPGARAAGGPRRRDPRARDDRPARPLRRAARARRPAARRRSCCSSSAPPSSPCSPLRAARTYTLTRRTTDLLVERRLRLARLGARAAAAAGLRHLGLLLRPRHGAAGRSLLIAIPAVLDLRHGGSSRPLVGDLAATELVGAEEAFLGPRVRSLMVDLAAQGPLDRGAHPPRRDAGLRGRRGAAPAARDAAPPRDRRPAPRHGQAARPAGDPLQAVRARPPRVRADQAPPGGRRAAAGRPRRLPGRGPRARARPPRASRRRWLPARPAGDADQPRHPRAHGLRRLRRARLRPRLPARLEPRPRARAAARGERGGLRPRVRRRPRARARPRRRRPGLGRRARAGAGAPRAAAPRR